MDEGETAATAATAAAAGPREGEKQRKRFAESGISARIAAWTGEALCYFSAGDNQQVKRYRGWRGKNEQRSHWLPAAGASQGLSRSGVALNSKQRLEVCVARGI